MDSTKILRKQVFCPTLKFPVCNKLYIQIFNREVIINQGCHISRDKLSSKYLSNGFNQLMTLVLHQVHAILFCAEISTT